MSSTLVFSFGPVQAFVAQARRTGDTWAGSYLLSYLAAKVIVAIERLETDGVMIVEPSRVGVPLLDAVRVAEGVSSATPSTGAVEIAALSNTVVVEIPDGHDPNTIGAGANDALLAAWRDIELAIHDWLMHLVAGGWEDLWRDQMATAWETYWAWGDTSLEAFGNLAARKGLRDFAQLTTTHSERCSVCGVRPALWVDNGKEGQTRKKVIDCWAEWGKLIVAQPGVSRTLIQPGGRERLCAVCFVKRCLPWVPNPVYELLRKRGGDAPVAAFVSTSTMATAHYRVELLEAARRDPEVAADMKDYMEVLRTNHLDRGHHPAEILPTWNHALNDHPSGLVTGNDAEQLIRLDGDMFLFGDSVINEYSVDREAAQNIRRAHRQLKRRAASNGVKAPPIYWALLTMDGDSMGAFLRCCADAGLPMKSVSKAINDFARGVPAIVSMHNGRTIYAGGDDVLAMLPLRDALGAAEELRLAFADAFLSWSESETLLAPQKARLGLLPTLSGAIVYAHHQAPLGAVLKAGHQLLKIRAKGMPDKNAVALQKLQRSGGGFACSAKWTTPDGGFAALMMKLIDHLEHDRLSTQSLYELQQEAWLFGPASGIEPEDMKKLLAYKLQRSRHRPAGEGGVSDEETATDVLGLCAMDKTPSQRQLAYEPLLMAAFLNGEGREDR